jgi:predicted TIM-barrel fold metal-dependent hydrolase
MADDIDMAGQLGTLRQLFQDSKIIGLKLYPGYQYFYPSDNRVDDFAKLCIEFNKPMVIHSGDVYDLDGEAILKYANPIHVDDLAVRFPELKIVIAHFGFPYLLECANIVSKNKNVYTDISGTITDDITEEESQRLFNQYKSDLLRVLNYFPEIKNKIMFGTDYGSEDVTSREAELFLRLVDDIFDESHRDNVLSGLAQKLFLTKKSN